MTTNLDNTIYFETTAEGFEQGDLEVSELRGFQAMSTPYEFSLQLDCSIDGGIGPEGIDALLAASAQVGFGPGAMYRISGVLREIRLVDMEQEGRRSFYEVRLVPRFWLSRLSHRSRVFNEMSVPDIIRAVLSEMQLAEGTDFELRLQGDYPVREYVAQYEESDFAFLSRWMERLGMFYCFEQTDAGEKLVVTDTNAELLPAPDHGECTYAQHDQQGVVGAVHRLGRVTRKMPERVHVREYNWRSPARPVQGDFDIDTEHGTGLQAYYGDHFKDDDEGAVHARLRGEEWLARKETYTASSTNPDFAPGGRFTVTGAPVGELDIEYVLTEVRHFAEQDSLAPGSGTYRNELKAIPYATVFRPPRITPWPRIDGVVHAKIDAESVSSAAPIDDQGRYRVVMPFDLYGEYGGRATRWIRKAEPYSGPSYGMHFTLHVGAEVLLAHVGGDPDRPVIVGSVPNPSTGTPLTVSNATRSAIRTRSGILIDFEDDA
ncbi:MAG: type VI secretion system tip protein TssI/VgrG [Myxococcota bacterium]|nr:type VI secretion system tip protein TssI/VgrG [Myxococcota bacterium]